jgi:pimeloyl-ACP methyl ester carboxylesterase
MKTLKNTCFAVWLALTITSSGLAQSDSEAGSSTNNLAHYPGYETCEYGAIPEFTKVGKGKLTLLLIPGLGFDATVFDDFIKANKNNYNMYVVTIPGYGNTKAPPMPTAGTSYGDQSWNKGVIEGLVKLIEKENLKRPVVVGHFVQGTQLALRMAIDHSDKIRSVIILGGPAKFISIINGEPKEFPLNGTISYVDKNTAPTWFKQINKNDFNDGNYLPEIYSLDNTVGDDLWKQSASVELPVMVRYLCEFFASDIKMEFAKIKCSVLVLRAMFSDKVLQMPINNYVSPQFINSWDDAAAKNPLIRVHDIQNSASFVWKDQPDEVYKAIKTFLNEKKLSSTK